MVPMVTLRFLGNCVAALSIYILILSFHFGKIVDGNWIPNPIVAITAMVMAGVAFLFIWVGAELEYRAKRAMQADRKVEEKN